MSTSTTLVSETVQKSQHFSGKGRMAESASKKIGSEIPMAHASVTDGVHGIELLEIFLFHINPTSILSLG